jgi:hypothetical protein
MVTALIVATHPPPGGTFGAATQSRGRHLVNVLRHAERAHGTKAILVISRRKDGLRDRYKDRRR